MKLTTERKQQIIDEFDLKVADEIEAHEINDSKVVRIGNLGQWSDDELKSELQVRNESREREENAEALLKIAYPHKTWAGTGVCRAPVNLRQAILKMIDAGVKPPGTSNER